MKNNILLAVLIIFSATLNLQARGRVPKPFQMSDEAKDPANAQTLYQRYYVSKVDGDFSAEIGGRWYAGRLTDTYFLKSGAIDAAEMARQAIEINHTGKSVKAWCWIGGAVLGGVGGILYGSQYANGDANFGSQRTFYGLIGGAGGALIGMFTGWPIYDQNYYPKAEAKFKEANNSFNQYLRQQLKLEIVPTAGGASGVLELNY